MLSNPMTKKSNVMDKITFPLCKSGSLISEYFGISQQPNMPTGSNHNFHEKRMAETTPCSNHNSQRIWSYLQIEWSGNDDLQSIVTAARRSFGHPFFMEVVITACWHIWLLRNYKTQLLPPFCFIRRFSFFIASLTLVCRFTNFVVYLIYLKISKVSY